MFRCLPEFSLASSFFAHCEGHSKVLLLLWLVVVGGGGVVVVVGGVGVGVGVGVVVVVVIVVVVVVVVGQQAHARQTTAVFGCMLVCATLKRTNALFPGSASQSSTSAFVLDKSHGQYC